MSNIDFQVEIEDLKNFGSNVIENPSLYFSSFPKLELPFNQFLNFFDFILSQNDPLTLTGLCLVLSDYLNSLTLSTEQIEQIWNRFQILSFVIDIYPALFGYLEALQNLAIISPIPQSFLDILIKQNTQNEKIKPLILIYLYPYIPLVLIPEHSSYFASLISQCYPNANEYQSIQLINIVGQLQLTDQQLSSEIGQFLLQNMWDRLYYIIDSNPNCFPEIVEKLQKLTYLYSNLFDYPNPCLEEKVNYFIRNSDKVSVISLCTLLRLSPYLTQESFQMFFSFFMKILALHLVTYSSLPQNVIDAFHQLSHVKNRNYFFDISHFCHENLQTELFPAAVVIYALLIKKFDTLFSPQETFLVLQILKGLESEYPAKDPLLFALSFIDIKELPAIIISICNSKWGFSLMKHLIEKGVQLSETSVNEILNYSRLNQILPENIPFFCSLLTEIIKHDTSEEALETAIISGFIFDKLSSDDPYSNILKGPLLPVTDCIINSFELYQDALKELGVNTATNLLNDPNAYQSYLYAINFIIKYDHLENFWETVTNIIKNKTQCSPENRREITLIAAKYINSLNSLLNENDSDIDTEYSDSSCDCKSNIHSKLIDVRSEFTNTSTKIKFPIDIISMLIASNDLKEIHLVGEILLELYQFEDISVFFSQYWDYAKQNSDQSLVNISFKLSNRILKFLIKQSKKCFNLDLIISVINSAMTSRLLVYNHSLPFMATFPATDFLNLLQTFFNFSSIHPRFLSEAQKHASTLVSWSRYVSINNFPSFLNALSAAIKHELINGKQTILYETICERVEKAHNNHKATELSVEFLVNMHDITSNPTIEKNGRLLVTLEHVWEDMQEDTAFCKFLVPAFLHIFAEDGFCNVVSGNFTLVHEIADIVCHKDISGNYPWLVEKFIKMQQNGVKFDSLPVDAAVIYAHFLTEDKCNLVDKLGFQTMEIQSMHKMLKQTVKKYPSAQRIVEARFKRQPQRLSRFKAVLKQPVYIMFDQ